MLLAWMLLAWVLLAVVLRGLVLFVAAFCHLLFLRLELAVWFAVFVALAVAFWFPLFFAFRLFAVFFVVLVFCHVPIVARRRAAPGGRPRLEICTPRMAWPLVYFSSELLHALAPEGAVLPAAEE